MFLFNPDYRITRIYLYHFQGLFGLTNAANHAGSGGSTQLSLTCGFVNSYTLTLFTDSLSSNLSWVQEMSISG